MLVADVQLGPSTRGSAWVRLVMASNPKGGMGNVKTKLLLAVAAVLLLQPAARITLAQDASSLAAQLRQTSGALQEISLIRYVPGQTDVPQLAVSLLPVFKRELRELFTSILDRSPDASAAELKRLFQDAIADAGLTPGAAEPIGSPYGTIYAVDVQMAQGKLIATTTLRVACGTDTSLYVHERAAGGWRRTLEVESNGYKTVAGARGDASWKIGGTPERGGWFLVMADVNPWCSSFWHGLRWVVRRPGPRAGRPEVIARASDSINIGFDEAYRLTADEKGFRLVWRGYDEVNPGFVRPHVASFTVTGRAVQRAHPVAFRPDGFLGEWVHATWKEAATWTRMAAQRSAKKWHLLLWKSPAKISYFSELDVVQPCPQPLAWQLGLYFYAVPESKTDPGVLPPGVPDILFFRVAQHGSRFEMVDVSPLPDPSCPGEQAPPPMLHELPN